MNAARGKSLQIEGTCVALEGFGLLLRGPSGAGKSDLALRLIDGGGALVADDLCEIWREKGRLMADLPAGVDAAFRGQIEVRGVGILTLAYGGPVALGLVVDLLPESPPGPPRPGKSPERLPPPTFVNYLDLAVPLIVLDPFQAAAAAKLRLVARAGPQSIMRPS